MKLLHCMREVEYLESALRIGLMLTDHDVEFAPTTSPSAHEDLIGQVLPVLRARLSELGQPLESLSTVRRQTIRAGIGQMKGRIPMLCLTEVPSGRVMDKHRCTFGSYGLVVSRRWVEEHGGDRVVYVGDNSALSRCLFAVTATTRALSLFVKPGGEVIFNQDCMRLMLDLLPYVQVRSDIEQAEWRIVGRHGFMGGERDTGKRLLLPLDEIENIFVPTEHEVGRISSVVDDVARHQKPGRVPTVVPFPDQIIA